MTQNLPKEDQEYGSTFFIYLICGLFCWGYYKGGKTLCISMFIAFLFILFFTLREVKEKNPVKENIFYLIIVFISLNFMFSSIYYYLYLRNPNNYNIAAGIQEGKYLNEYTAALSEFNAINKKLYLSATLLSKPETVLKAVTQVSERSKSDKYKIDDKIIFYLEHYLDMISLPDGGNSIIEGNMLEFMINGESIKIFDNEVSKLEDDALSGTLLKAKTNAEMFSQINNFISKLNEKKIKLEGELSRYSLLNSNLNYIDFLYFSTITITTTGYGDIIPNSRIVRLIVILQTLMGVFYIGYTLTIITSAQKQNYC